MPGANLRLDENLIFSWVREATEKQQNGVLDQRRVRCRALTQAALYSLPTGVSFNRNYH
jgi:hypothetical protein